MQNLPLSLAALPYHGPMENTRAGISSFWLKVAAIVAMTCNHVANAFAGMLPLPAVLALYSLGGVTFPIMAFLLTEGYTHTSNLRRYALRLAAFAVVAQVPYSLLWGAVPNVLFTLLVSLGVLWARDRLGARPAFVAVMLAAVVVTLPFDWGSVGVVMVFLFRTVPGRRGILGGILLAFALLGLPAIADLASAPPGVITSFSGYPPDPLIAGSMAPGLANTILQAGPLAATWGDALYAAVGFTIAAVLILAYDGRRGRSLKWFFYAYYPAHLLVIWAIKALVS